MALTAELIYQGLVLSSIFLMAISLPKLLIYTAWSSWRMFVYDRMLETKVIRKILSDEAIQKNLKPEEKFARTVREMEFYTRDMKKPLVELFSAFLLLPLAASGLHIESDAVQLIVVLEAVMVLVFILTFRSFIKMFLKMQKLKDGGPLA